MSAANPLRNAYVALLEALHLPVNAAAATASIDEPRRLYAWCMHAIQTLTAAAPAARRAGAAGGLAGSSAQAGTKEAALVLQFLSNMLQLFQLQPHLLEEDDEQQQQMDDGASQSSTATSFGGRSLLPFLYAHLFKYCLYLHDYESYYSFLLNMPATFESAEEQLEGDSGKLKLESLKRLIIELLREKRTHEIVRGFNWNFSWEPSQPNSSAVEAGEKTVREEVEAMLWWNAQTSDIGEEEAAIAGSVGAHSSTPFAQPSSTGVLSADASGVAGSSTTGAGHYDLLYSFLISGHSYLRAAQSMHHFFLRLESETSGSGATGGTGGSAANFVAATVARMKKGRGRVLNAPATLGGQRGSAVAATHSEQTQAELSALTLEVAGRLLRRKLHALLLVRDALRLAARSSNGGEPDLRECFMLENDVAIASLQQQQQQLQESKEKEAADQLYHPSSPLYKRSRNAMDDIAVGAGAGGDEAAVSTPLPLSSRLDLLSLRGVEKRLELVLSQLDMLSVLQSRVSGVGRSGAAASYALPPLDALLDTPSTPSSLGAHVAELVKFGLLDRAFHFVQVFNDASTDLESNPLREPFELAASFVFRQITQRICRMTASQDEEAEDADDADSYPLRVEDSIAELQLTGSVSKGMTDGHSAAAIRVRDAEQVLQLHLDRLDQGHAFLLAVAEEYLAAGAEIPLWMRDRFCAFMADSPAIGGDEQSSSSSFSMFQLGTASSRPSGHALTLASFPFLTFLRLLLSASRFEVLYELAARYLDWLVSPSATSAAGGAVTFDREAMADIFDGFLCVQDHASSLSRSEESKQVQKQVNEWVDNLQRKIVAVVGNIGAASRSAGGKGAEQRLVSGGGAAGGVGRFAAPSSFGSFGGGGSGLLPTPAASASTGGLFRTGAAAATPAASPFAGTGGGFGAATATTPAAAAAPSASPFASDHSAAATPSKHPFGGMPSLAPTTTEPAAAAAAKAGFTGGFGSGFSFAASTNSGSAAGGFGFGAPAAAPSAAPFSFGGASTAAASPFSFGSK